MYRPFLTLLLILKSLLLQAQQMPVPPAEKIHLHFDKDIYLPGEKVWVKAYLYSNGQPSFLSTNFYMAVYNDAGELLQQKQYPVFNSTSSGDFDIPDSISSGSLRFRAYTKGLLNADSLAFYERTVRIFHKDTALQFKQQVLQTSLSFSWEGGTPVADLDNLLVIKSVFENGSPVAVNGIIKEEASGRVVDSFTTSSHGLATLQFIPEKSKNYSVEWKEPGGRENKTAFAVAAQPGVKMHFEKKGGSIYCNILKNSTAQLYDTLQLSARYAMDTVYTAKLLMNKNIQWVNKIPADSLPEGIIHFELYGSGNTLLQQRLFLNTGIKPGPGLTIIKKNLDPKGENELELDIPDSLFYTLSIAVTDAGFYNETIHRDIDADLWYDALLPGNEKGAKPVLLQNNETEKEALLITVPASQQIKPFNAIQRPLDNYLSVYARYQHKKNVLPQGNSLILVTADTVQGKRYYKLPPAGQTDFIKEGLLFYDSAQFHFRLDKEKDETSFITIENAGRFFPASLIGKMQYIQPAVKDAKENVFASADTVLTAFATNKPSGFNKMQTMKEVRLKSRYVNPITKRMLELDDKYTTGMFHGLARGVQLNVLDDKNAWAQSDILGYLAYRLGISVCTDKWGQRYFGAYPCNPANRMLVFLNEVEMYDQEGIGQLSMTQVAYVKYIRGIVIGSSFVSSNGSGALYIYTKKGDEPEQDERIPMKMVKLKGYDIPANFVAPDYTDKKNLLNTDMRTTLYWNPLVTTEGINNKIKIIFHNNDVSKKLRVTVEGFTEDGRLIHLEKTVE